MGRDVRVHLFGRVALSVNGKNPDVGGARQRAFLSFLASQANKTVSREEIIDAVWGDSPPHSVTSSIHTYVARIRRALEPEREPRSPSEALEFDGLGYRMNLDTDNIDTHLFESCLEQAKLRTTASADHLISAYDRALQRWVDSPLVGVPGPFPEMERHRLEELHRSALEERYTLLIATSRYQEAVHGLSRFARQHPLREQLRGLLITAYYLAGRRSEALMEFQSLREDLVRHLGIEPNPDLQKKYLKILRGECVALPESTHQPPARPSPTTPFQLPRVTPVLVGREAELKALHSLAENPVCRRKSMFLHIDGPPGTGKSALAVRFAHEISSSFPDGQLYVDLRGASASGPPLTSDQALGDLLFGLGERAPGSLPPERLSGLFRSLTSSKRILIMLDNAASEEQVRTLLPGSPQCGVIVTSRTRMTNLAIRDGAQRITLGPLANEDAALMVLQSVSRALSEQNPLRPPRMPDSSEIMELCRSHSRIPLPLHALAERLARAVSSSQQKDTAMLDRLLSEGHDQSFASDQISWSYRLLPADTALVFRAVGLSNAEVLDTQAVSAVLRADVADADHHLVRLADHNLLYESGPGRVSMRRYLKLYAREASLASDPEENRTRWLKQLAEHYRSAASRASRVLVGASDTESDDTPVADDRALPRFETREHACAWLRDTRATLWTAMHDARAG